MFKQKHTMYKLILLSKFKASPTRTEAVVVEVTGEVEVNTPKIKEQKENFSKIPKT